MDSSVLIFIFFNVLFVNATNFGYSREEQAQWKYFYLRCGGHNQSPISINNSCAHSIGMPNLKLYGYDKSLPGGFKLSNNGHTVVLSINRNNMSDNSEIPHISGALLDNCYEFEGLHFHWGKRNNRGSEHTLDDLQYPLEMHLIHRNQKYCSLKDALKHNDGLAILAIFFDLTEKYSTNSINLIIQELNSVQNFNEHAISNNKLKLLELLPEENDVFYTYKGSLTTPPCSESVDWIIFPDPVPVSFDQMNEFRSLKNKENKPLSDNFRYIQPIGNRRIYIRNPDLDIANFH